MYGHAIVFGFVGFVNKVESTRQVIFGPPPQLNFEHFYVLFGLQGLMEKCSEQ